MYQEALCLTFRGKLYAGDTDSEMDDITCSFFKACPKAKTFSCVELRNSKTTFAVRLLLLLCVCVRVGGGLSLPLVGR